MHSIVKSTAAEAFRAKASDLLSTSAVLTLHQLVDEFLRLTSVMEANLIEDDEDYGPKLTVVGEIAQRERMIVNGAARARFGVGFEPHDRMRGDHMDGF